MARKPKVTSSLHRYFTTGEAATLCHVTPRVIRHRIDHGEIKAVVMPGVERRRRLIPYEELRRFMEVSGFPLDDIDRAAGVAVTKTILIIDDEKHYCDLLKEYFEKDRRVAVEVAYTGARGVALIADLKPDLLILDLRLPDLDGRDVLEAVEGLEPHKEARILVYSAHIEKDIEDDPELKERFEELGTEAFITKAERLNRIKDRAYKMLGICRRREVTVPRES